MRKDMHIMNFPYDDFNKCLIDIYIDYYNLYPHLPKMYFDVILTDNLMNYHLKLRPDLREELISSGIESQNDYNGRMVPPKNVGDTISILINKSKIEEYSNDGTMTWLGTFAHEFTHAHDYYRMAVKNNIVSYDTLLSGDYYMFQLWSEFHARIYGYKFLINFHYGNRKDYIKILKDVFDNASITYLDSEKEFIERNVHKTNIMYTIMQMLGRFAVWNEYFPDVYNEKYLSKKFQPYIWITKLFSYLINNKELNMVTDNFSEMTSIISNI